MVQHEPKILADCAVTSDFVSEELEDVADALSPMYDQLQRTWKWWILEATPQPIYYQDDCDDHDVIEYT